MPYKRIVSANKDSIKLEGGTTFNPINYRNHLKLYDENGNINTNLDQFYNEYNGQFISNVAPMLIGLYVDTHDVTTSGGGGSSRRKNYKKSVRRVKYAKRASRSRSRKYRNRK